MGAPQRQKPQMASCSSSAKPAAEPTAQFSLCKRSKPATSPTQTAPRQAAPSRETDTTGDVLLTGALNLGLKGLGVLSVYNAFAQQDPAHLVGALVYFNLRAHTRSEKANREIERQARSNAWKQRRAAHKAARAKKHAEIDKKHGPVAAWALKTLT